LLVVALGLPVFGVPAAHAGSLLDTCNLGNRFLAVDMLGGLGINPSTDTGAGAQKLEEFNTTDNGNVEPVKVVAGPHTGLHGPQSGLRFDNRGHMWVNNDPHQPDESLEEFPCSANYNGTPPAGYPTTPVTPDDIAPMRVITGTDATSYNPEPTSDRFWLNHEAENEISEYPPDANGDNPTPLRTIGGPHTLIDHPEGIAFGSRGEIVVMSTGDTHHADYTVSRICIFAPDAFGDATPIRVIEGPDPFMHVPSLAVVVNDLIYVNTEFDVGPGFNPASPSGSAGILVFHLTDSGDVTPTHNITGPATGLSKVLGVYYDSVDGLITNGNLTGAYPTPPTPVPLGCDFPYGCGTVTEFDINAINASGPTANLAPVRTVAGANTGFVHALGGVIGPYPNPLTSGGA
jgi:hypothetical protein